MVLARMPPSFGASCTCQPLTGAEPSDQDGGHQKGVRDELGGFKYSRDLTLASSVSLIRDW